MSTEQANPPSPIAAARDPAPVYSQRYSLCKAVSWRIIGSSDTFLIAWIISGAVAKAGLIAVVEFLTKPLLYYLHERVWARASFGLDFSAGPKAPGSAAVSERRTRSLVKAVSWRIIATLDTIIIALLITGSLPASLAIGVIEIITKTILYYFHERLWNRMSHWPRLPVACQAAPEPSTQFSASEPSAAKR